MNIITFQKYKDFFLNFIIVIFHFSHYKKPKLFIMIIIFLQTDKFNFSVIIILKIYYFKKNKKKFLFI